VLPIIAALAGHDFVIARALMPAWIPLAVVIGAACTVRHARTAGAVLAALMVALFLLGLVRVQSSPDLQRPDWRGVARALGPAWVPRAIVLDAGGLGTDPLAFYLPGVPWNQPSGQRTVTEIDIVGNTYQDLSRRLPAGLEMIDSRAFGGFRVVRLRLATALSLTRAQAAARVASALTPVAPAPPVLMQRAALRAGSS
jgi:hypothetical protein